MSDWDELHVTISNTGDLCVVLVDLELLADGETIPDAIASKCWDPELSAFDRDIFSSKWMEVQFVRDNRYDEPVYGLGPGESHTYELSWANDLDYISGDDQREAERYGLRKRMGPREADWDVRLRGANISRGERHSERSWGRTHHRYKDRPLAEVFAQQASELGTSLNETDELASRRAALDDARTRRASLEQRMRSLHALAVVDSAESELARCRERAQVLTDYRFVSEVLAYIGGEKPLTPEVDSLLIYHGVPIVLYSNERELGEALLDFLGETAAGAAWTSADGGFLFENVPSGQHTLVAQYNQSRGSPVHWIVEVEVSGDTAVDLAPHNSTSGPLLSGLLEQLES
jgi:hypothetical protein